MPAATSTPTPIPADEAVAALVDAARRTEGGRDREAGPAIDARREGRRSRVRTLDFSRPAKFTSDQERRVARVLDTFCRTASTRLSADLRMPVEMELLGTAQLTWANAHAQLPAGAICGIVGVTPVGTRMLLATELQLVLAAVERLLGGTVEAVPAERKLTEIDWVVARLFFQRLVTQLSAVFNDAAGVALELAGVEGRLDSEQLAGVSEPTLAVTLEVRHDSTSSTVSLLLPYAAFAPLADAFTGSTGAAGAVDGDGASVERAVAGVDVLVHAEVGALELPVEAVLAVRPGDVLRLGGPATAGVALTVGGIPVRRASPGRAGPRRAVQVLP